MITSESQPPPVGIMGGSVWSYERCLDPWHADAFLPEFRYVGTRGKRASGWMALDSVGNPVGFFPDGTEIPDPLTQGDQI